MTIDTSSTGQKAEEYSIQEMLVNYQCNDPETTSECTSVPNNYQEIYVDDALKVTVFDVAEYILRKLGPLTTMKLQKLVYYCQAWSLVWDEEPLFDDEIQAWANGPVVPNLFDYHRGIYKLECIHKGNPTLLSKTQRETIDVVLDSMGDLPAQRLIELSHSETPWLEARKGMPTNMRGNKVISQDAIADYFSAILAD